MIAAALRSLRQEPRAADPPAPGWRDAVMVAAVIVAALLEGAFARDVPWRSSATAVAVALAPLLLWRRAHPLVCVLLAFGISTALGLAGAFNGVTGVGLDTMFYVLVFVYALVRWGSGLEIVVGLVVVTIAALSSLVADDASVGELLGGFAVLAAAVAGGAAFRYRAESWRREMDQIRSQERVGLARELHDTVAHHVSAITVQAQAGRTLAATRPEAALEALAVIETEASRTLAEMRSMVRVLRDGEPAQYAPQPGIADVMLLARPDTIPVVDVQVTGDVAAVGPQVDAAVYRIAQESLTNALRHARDASRVEILVAEDTGRLRIRVSDDGRTDPARSASHGYGLMGMAERVQLLGGTLSAGPRPGGGWMVEAELPTEARS